MLYVVIGPPAGGKSTWVRSVASPGDIVIDYDVLAETLTHKNPEHHKYSSDIHKVVRAARQAAIDASIPLADHMDVYLVHSIPSDERMKFYRSHGARIITIDPGRDVVMSRAKGDRPWWMVAAIKKWYERRPDGVGESVSSWVTSDW